MPVSSSPSEDPLSAAELALKDALQALELARKRQHELEEEVCAAAHASHLRVQETVLPSENRTLPRAMPSRIIVADRSSWLCSDVVTLKVHGDETVAHLSVLQTSPYFSARLERWDTGAVIDLTLPDGCEISDMLDVLHHMYCPDLPWCLDNAISGLRAAAIADLWQLDDLLPALGKAVSAKVSSNDIFEVRTALNAPWPPAFLEPLKCFMRDGEMLDQPAVHQMVKGAISTTASENAYMAARTIFSSYTSTVLADIAVDVMLEIIEAGLLGTQAVWRAQWLLATLVEHTTPKQAEPVFAKISDMQISLRCSSCYRSVVGDELSTAHVSVLRKAFEAHIMRCVTHDDVSTTFSLGVSRLGLCPCGACLSGNILAFSGTQLVHLARQAPKSQVGLIGGLLTLNPKILRTLLTPELLTLFPAEDQKALVECLATDLNTLRNWAVSQCWPWAIRHLSHLPWPACSLTELAFPHRCLAKVPWASAEPAARSLQPFLLSLPRDVCAMLVPFCAVVEDTSRTNMASLRPANVSRARQLCIDTCLGVGILLLQFAIGMIVAIVIKWAANVFFKGQDWATELAPSMVTTLIVVCAETFLGMRGVVCIYYIAEPVIGIGTELSLGVLGLAALLPLPDVFLRYNEKVNLIY